MKTKAEEESFAKLERQVGASLFWFVGMALAIDGYLTQSPWSLGFGLAIVTAGAWWNGKQSG
jgi:hypothetical protein